MSRQPHLQKVLVILKPGCGGGRVPPRADRCLSVALHDTRTLCSRHRSIVFFRSSLLLLLLLFVVVMVVVEGFVLLQIVILRLGGGSRLFSGSSQQTGRGLRFRFSVHRRSVTSAGGQGHLRRGRGCRRRQRPEVLQRGGEVPDGRVLLLAPLLQRQEGLLQRLRARPPPIGVPLIASGRRPRTSSCRRLMCACHGMHRPQAHVRRRHGTTMTRKNTSRSII